MLGASCCAEVIEVDTPTSLACLLQAVAALLVGMTIYVAYRHFRRWRNVPEAIPMHCWLVALSYDLLVITVVLEASLVIDWRWIFYVPAMAFGVVGMTILSRRYTQ